MNKIKKIVTRCLVATMLAMPVLIATQRTVRAMESTPKVISESKTGRYYDVLQFSVIIGDRVFLLDWANDPQNEEIIRKAIVENTGEIYVHTSGSDWINNNTGATPTVEELASVIVSSFNDTVMLPANIVVPDVITPVGTTPVVTPPVVIPPISPGGGGGGVTRVDVSAITVTPITMNLTVGGATGTITETVAPANATNKNVTWLSSNTSVATVVGGVVTPVAPGTATITVTSSADGTKTATCFVTVISAEEAALQATAEIAVAAYETAAITTLSEVNTAEGLKAAADTAVVAVGNEVAKETFEGRITNRAAAIASQKTALEATAEAVLQATAETAVAAYENAAITTLAEVTTAEGLKAAADTAVAAVGNAEAKTAFAGRVSTRTTAIASAKAALQEIALQATAETAVAAYENAAITTLAEVTIAEGLKAAADTAVAAVDNAAAKTAFAGRVSTRATAIASAKAALQVEAAKAAAKGELATALTTYTQSNYEPVDWTTLNAFKTAGDNAINAATDLNEVNTAKSTSINGMAGVLKKQAAPITLTGVAPTSYADKDGKISGTTTSMQYKLSSGDDSEYIDCSSTATTGLKAGEYDVRLKAKTGYNAGTIATVTVTAFEPSGVAMTIQEAKDAGFQWEGWNTGSDFTGTITYYSKLDTINIIIPFKIGNEIVKIIGDRAFEGDYPYHTNRFHEKVEFPNSLTYIGVSAFGGIPALKNVTIGNHVAIGDGAFSYSLSTGGNEFRAQYAGIKKSIGGNYGRNTSNWW